MFEGFTRCEIKTSGARIVTVRGGQGPPLLLMHGAADTLSPPDHAERLFAAAGEPKEIWIAPSVAHAALYEQVADDYRARISAFFDRWLAG